MFSKILIANRGEIACRVMRTAKRLGVGTVAVYSDADARARHVLLADEACRIGSAEARDSYLNIERIIAAAKASGAQAVHPGYGFLSENAGFAEACAKAGLAFIGPPATAIRAMGSKSAAKTLMHQAGVPLVPGYHGDKQDAALLQKEAGKTGYPVLIKASAGGGGKGMRIVGKAADFAAALASCQREAKASFGDDKVLIEKYLQRPRHIEIQVFADTLGNALHLFERDCSVQRRHQKVLEEAPAPGMTPARRKAMGDAAVAAAKAVGYVGAGTVEFIVPGATGGDDAFYFMEMNTRLQVEHPVTEMITGLDLVEWQLRVAAGEALPLRQEQLAIRGHALEARIYAEDTARDFLPATGRIAYLATPAESAHVRIDTGIAAGDTITPWYDPMIAKLIVWDIDRPAALARMRGALAEYQVAGVTTNTGFLSRLVGCKAFAAADLDTGLIARSHDELFPPPTPAGDAVLALASFAELAHQQRAAQARAAASTDAGSPWALSDGWRLNQDNQHELRFRDGEREASVIVHFRAKGWELDLNGRRCKLLGERLTHHDGNESANAGRLAIWLDDAAIAATVVRRGALFDVFHAGAQHSLELHDPLAHAASAEENIGNLTAPMPGKVVAVLVKPGDTVQAGTPLLVLEAMKMEHTICAPADGVIAAVHYQAGEQVSEGAELLSVEAAKP